MPARAGALRENLARTRLVRRDLVESDARDFDGTAPLVLIDAPCTATGTIRRHPDLPWIKGAADVTAQRPLAYEILESGARAWSSRAGLLVFAVCSLEREEGEEQIAAFLAAHPRIRALCRSRRKRCSVMANGSRRRATCAPCPVTCRTRAAWTAFMPRELAALIRRPERVSDRQINLAGIGRENGRGQQPAAIAFARACASKASNSPR